MMKFKDILQDHKFNYNMVKNPDSIHNRAASAKKASGGGDGPLDGKEIQKMLGIEDEGPKHPGNKEPLRLMDLVMQALENGDAYEDFDEET